MAILNLFSFLPELAKETSELGKFLNPAQEEIKK